MAVLLPAGQYVAAEIITKDEPWSPPATPAEPADPAKSAIYEVTAYTAGPESTGKRPGDVGYGITASGARVTTGVTAACPPEIPFGTVIWIDGVGERVCQDRGGAIRGNRLDIYMHDLNAARAFGRQRLSVKVVQEQEVE